MQFLTRATLASFGLVTLIACGGPRATTPSTGSGADALTQGATPQVFTKFDANGDGKIDATEVPADVWQVLQKADANGDGGVTLDEIVDALTNGLLKPPHGKGHHPHCPPLWKLDQDGDGAISQAEAGKFWPELVKADANGDGKVTDAELQTAIAAGLFAGPPPREFHVSFDKLDADGNGVVTQAEAGAAWGKLEVADADKNGEVTKAEYDAAIAAGTLSPGEDGDDHHGGQQGGNEGPFGKFDINGDGFIDQNEVPPAVWGKISAADTDKDGKISKDELHIFLEANEDDDDKGGQPGSGDCDGPLAKFDSNADGALEQSEVPPELWGKISAADTDQDGKVTKDELQAFFDDQKGDDQEGDDQKGDDQEGGEHHGGEHHGGEHHK